MKLLIPILLLALMGCGGTTSKNGCSIVDYGRWTAYADAPLQEVDSFSVYYVEVTDCKHRTDRVEVSEAYYNEAKQKVDDGQYPQYQGPYEYGVCD